MLASIRVYVGMYGLYSAVYPQGSGIYVLADAMDRIWESGEEPDEELVG